jgi:menaquinol-cytochrome c reductase iron-sulfur subunit
MSESTRPDPDAEGPLASDPASSEASSAEAESRPAVETSTAKESAAAGALVQRRRFLARVSIGLGAVGGLAIGAPLVGFVVAPLGREVPRLWRSVGKVRDFRIGETVNVKFVDTSPLPWAGVTANTGAWLRRISEDTFTAFAINCAHLGCPVRWLADARLFMCPCHGGVYYEDGTVAAGPPPHPLSQYLVRIEGDEVLIRADPIPFD